MIIVGREVEGISKGEVEGISKGEVEGISEGEVVIEVDIDFGQQNGRLSL